MNVIAGPDPHNSTAATAPLVDYRQKIEGSIRGKRIGLSPDYFQITFPDSETGELRHEPISPEIETAVLKAAGRLAELRADIVEDVPMPHTPYGVRVYFVIHGLKQPQLASLRWG